MEIRCPECGYARKVNPDSVSPDLTVATCPKCSSKFRINLVEEKEPDFVLDQDKETMQVEAPASEATKAPASEPAKAPTFDSSKASASEQTQTPIKPPVDSSEEELLRMVYSDGQPLEGQRMDGMPTDVPWAEVKELGFFPAIIATIKGVLFKPSLFFEIMSKDGKFSIPFSYFILVSLAAVLVETVWQSVFGNPLIPAESVGPLTIDELFSIMFISPLILVLYLFTTGAVLHGALKLTGATENKLSVTLKVLCYASSADLLSIVPVVGPLVGGVWKLIIIVKGLKSAHNTTYTRVIPPVGILVLVLVSFVVYSLKSQGIM